MVKIVVVEDNEIDFKILENNIRLFFSNIGKEYKLLHFNDGESVINNPEVFRVTDLFFLDIELPEMSGMDLAIKLRKNGSKSTIIFITNMVQYAVQGYDVSALDFVVKPIETELFQRKMSTYMARISGRRKTFLMHNRQGIKKYRISEITFVEVRAHKIYIHTIKGEDVFSGTLKQIEDELKDCGFARCNKCYLVNLRYVNNISNDEVDVDGHLLQISRREKKQFMEKFAEYEGDS